MREIIIDPITRLEGHGKIIIFLDEKGNCIKAYLQIPEIRGFEKFAEGRLIEEMPQITSRICGVCPMAHHMASTKALDDIFNVSPPYAAKLIRELAYNIFMLEDHALHVYILGGPDFFVGPKAPKEERNVFGVFKKLGKEIGLKVIKIRKKLRNANSIIAGRTIHPVFGLAGGVSKPLKNEEIEEIKKIAEEGLDFALFTLKLFKKIVLEKDEYFNLITNYAYYHETYYMGLVDDKNRINFYEGKIRVINPKGNELAKFDVKDYLNYISEHVEPWTYVKFPYLKKIGWKGFVDGEKSGIMCVAPLARLNVSNNLPTHFAQEAYEEMVNKLGKPIHFTLVNHWARIIEMVYSAERIKEIINDPEIKDQNVRKIPTEIKEEGFGVVEAPRGTLIHHYKVKEKGIVEKANLLVATQHNAARIALSIDKAAKYFIKGGNIHEEMLNMVEMAFRAYDACHACASHSLPGSMPFKIYIYNSKGILKKIINYNP